MIRVLICDDQNIVCEGLRTILSTVPGMEVIGTAQDAERAVTLAGDLLPDVILMDLKMPGHDGAWATQTIRERYPAIRVLVLTTYGDEDWLYAAIRAGASGYLLKDTPRDSLVEAIQGTVEGKTYVDPDVAGKLFASLARLDPQSPATLTDGLTEREVGVLRLISKGLNNAEIAERLHLSEGTVRNYVSSILSKLNIADRTQAALLAIRHGIVADD